MQNLTNQIFDREKLATIRRWWMDIDKINLLLVVGLILFGFIMTVSSSTAIAKRIEVDKFYFIKKYLDDLLAQAADIDTIVLGCTHYPLLLNKIKEYLPAHIKIISQSEIVAAGLKDLIKSTVLFKYKLPGV